MIRLSRAVVVEGKYDRARLASLIDAPILQTDGFGLFRDRELQALLRRYAHSCGLIVLTDSDSAGRLIRGRISSIVGEGADVVHLYIPKISGKERRKTTQSREGLLGVEGMDTQTLTALFSRFCVSEQTQKDPLVKGDLYKLSLFGAPDCTQRRAAVAREFDLPEDLSVNRLLDALNFFSSKEELTRVCERLFGAQS